MKTLAGIVFALLVTIAATASTTAQDIEHYFRFTIKQKAELDRLTRIVSVANVVHDTVYAYANEKEWETFHALGYDAIELPRPGSQYEHEISNSPLGVPDWDRYPTYQAYLAMMRQYAANFPSICRLDTIGFSVQGRLILALKISDNVNVHEDEPQFLYTSTMHGDETVGYVLLLRLADYLLNQYGQSTAEGQRVSTLVNTVEIWLNPLFNPDGTYRFGGDTTVSRARRYNANGVDLNRNFPDRINDPNNTPTGRQTETQEMMRWTKNHNFTLSANFHCGVQVVNYPWDNGASSGTYSSCPDDAWFIHLSRVYAATNPDLMNGEFLNGITNGCDWYVIFGGRQDWMYWWNGGREVTIELDNTYIAPGSVLPQRWENNRESFLAYMEEALKGIRGIVTNAVIRAPLKARVDVEGFVSVPVFTDSSVGDYHRLLLPGTYSVIVRAPGYLPDTVRNVIVTDSLATRVDVALHPSPRAVLSVNTERMDFGAIDVNAPRRDSTFLVENLGGASDSIYISVNYVNVTPESAVTVSPAVFELPAGASRAITFSIRPRLLSSNRVYNASVLIDSRFGYDITHFEKPTVFEITGTLVSAKEQSTLPTEFALEQNYPNPFNPATKIQLSIVNRLLTIVKVYDVLGREVSTLVNEVKEAGTYTVEFDGSNLTSGVYFYRLTAGSFLQTRKMVFVR